MKITSGRGSRRRLMWIAAGVMTTAGTLAAVTIPGAMGAGPPAAGLHISVEDTQFALTQIQIAEKHAATTNAQCTVAIGLTVANCATPGTTPLGPNAGDIADPLLMQGLRQTDGRNNNLVTGFSVWNGRSYNPAPAPGNSVWGSADQFFPVLTGLLWRSATFDNNNGLAGPAGASALYSNRTANLVDSAPRTISNLISDQNASNPAAVTAAGGANAVTGSDGSVLIPNQPPAGGAAAPYNGTFALFGQFFDHGLDLVDKDSGHYVRVNLALDDPLYCAVGSAGYGKSCSDTMFMNRTTLNGTLQARNTTTPWIDQNQTYTSHPSHQAFLREYVCSGVGATNVCDASHPPVATGKMADSTNPAHVGDLANWTEIKQQAQDKLGINLDDYDVNNVPLLLTNEYGRFIPGPTGFPLVVKANGSDLSEGNPASPVQTVDFSATRAGAATTPASGPQDLVSRIGHAFVNDMAQGAAPLYTCGTSTACVVNSAGDPQRGVAGFVPSILGSHFIMGDGRGNENIGLTAIHTIFHAEHNRVVDDLKAVILSANDPTYTAQWEIGGVDVPGAPNWDGQRLMQGAKLVTEMEYQHLVFGEFARLVEPGVAAFTQYNPTIRPDISAEFAHAVYRFGHSMLNPTIDRKLANGTDASLNLLDAFTAPTKFNDNGAGGNLTGPEAAGAVARGMTNQRGNEIDEFVTNTLRNTLLGQPLDLPTLNILRGRDSGTQSLQGTRRALWTANNNDPSLAPYVSWNEFGLALRHHESLVNFIAAYGTDPTIQNATTIVGKRNAASAMMLDAGFMNSTGAFAPDAAGKPTTGLEDIDLWVGGLAEASINAPGGSMLGGTFAFIFKNQLESLQDPDRFYYLGRLAGTNLGTQIEGNTFAEMVIRNTGADNMPLNAFIKPTKAFDMNTAPIPADINDGGVGSATNWMYTGCAACSPTTPTADSIFTGTPNNDSMTGGKGSDTMRGGDGNDTIAGNLGNDSLYGGNGNDILTDSGGTNVMAGADGNDYFGASGADQLIGGFGADFFSAGGNPTAIIGGVGNDLISGSTAADAVTGDDNSDWIEGGNGIDTLIGDSAPPFSIDLNKPGDDVVTGGAGGDILNGDGGVDLFPATVSTEGDATAGGFGFDFRTYADATAAVTADLGLGAAPAGVLTTPDTFLDVEGLSGGAGADTLSGDSRTTLASVTPGGNDNLLTADIAKFRGLDTLLGVGVTGYTTGNILMGGGGADTIEGRGGNDLISGDASLVTRISVPNVPVVAGTCPGITGTTVPDAAVPGNVLATSVLQLRQAVLAGCLDPTLVQYVRTVDPGTAGAGDVAVFSGNIANYSVTPSAGRLTVVDNRAGSPDGTDTLIGIESLQFANGAVTPPQGVITGGSIVPASTVAGATGNLVVTMTNQTAIPVGGKVAITIPAGYRIGTNGLGAGTTATYGGAAPLTGTNTLAFAGQVVTITHSVGVSVAPGTSTMTLSAIRNPLVPGATGNGSIATSDGAAAPLDSGSATGATITGGALTAVSVTPASLQTSATGSVPVVFTPANPVPLDGKVRVTFPAGYNLSGVGANATLAGMTGTASVGVSGQVVTITRSGGTASTTGVAKTVTISGVTNPSAAGPTGTYSVATLTAGNVVIDTGTAAAVTLIAPPPPPAAVSLTTSTASRARRVITITVRPSSTATAVAWTAVLRNPARTAPITVTGTVPAGAASQVRTVTVPANWITNRPVTTVTLTPTGGAAATIITVR